MRTSGTHIASVLDESPICENEYPIATARATIEYWSKLAAGVECGACVALWEIVQALVKHHAERARYYTKLS